MEAAIQRQSRICRAGNVPKPLSKRKWPHRKGQGHSRILSLQCAAGFGAAVGLGAGGGGAGIPDFVL